MQLVHAYPKSPATPNLNGSPNDEAHECAQSQLHVQQIQIPGRSLEFTKII